MTIFEAYCNACFAPAPVRIEVEGPGAGNRVRAAYVAYHRRLRREFGWLRRRGLDYCCRDCARGVPEEEQDD